MNPYLPNNDAPLSEKYWYNDRPLRSIGNKAKPRRSAVYYKYEDRYFPGHCCANKTIMAMEKIVMEKTLKEKISTIQPYGQGWCSRGGYCDEPI